MPLCASAKSDMPLWRNLSIIVPHFCSVIWVGVFVTQSKRTILGQSAYGPEFMQTPINIVFSNAMLTSLNGRQRFRDCTTVNVSDLNFGLPHPICKADTMEFGDAELSFLGCGKAYTPT
ncbi:hypothetical protein MVEN_00163800 [Mycena venus]|uniref:Uncharacterized protein n=1 Tax=Mycena venus TaxID=2733690 RepID=A0A8H7DDS0_9AGAR|nr:hypothetical protein MVEN_00163800 [Mycena venus]